MSVEGRAEKNFDTLARKSNKVRLLFAFWLLFTVWTAWGTISNGLAALQNSGTAPDQFAPFDPSPFFFCLNFWGLAAALFVGVIVRNPYRWLNGKRLAFGCIAVATMLGRLISGGLGGLLLASVQVNGLLVFVALPFVLAAAGAAMIVGIGITAAMLFGVFVGIPVAIFQQIFAFEHALAVYRYQSRGLASYICRFILWLRNEPLPAALPDASRGARLATLPEIASLHAPVPESMAFGHVASPLLPERILSPLFLKTDKHILIMASTRSGNPYMIACLSAAGKGEEVDFKSWHSGTMN